MHSSLLHLHDSHHYMLQTEYTAPDMDYHLIRNRPLGLLLHHSIWYSVIEILPRELSCKIGCCCISFAIICCCSPISKAIKRFNKRFNAALFWAPFFGLNSIVDSDSDTLYSPRYSPICRKVNLYLSLSLKLNAFCNVSFSDDVIWNGPELILLDCKFHIETISDGIAMFGVHQSSCVVSLNQPFILLICACLSILCFAMHYIFLEVHPLAASVVVCYPLLKYID